jgi:hypothetical protein
MLSLIKDIQRYLFLLGTAGMVVGLPLWPILLSVSQFTLGINWLLQSIYSDNWKRLWFKRSIVLLSSIYLVHLIGLFNSHDYTYALNDLKIKIPLFALPIIYGASDPLSEKEFNFMMKLFIGAVLISSLISTVIILGFTKIILTDSRYASIFIPHIRFSLLLVLTICILFYYLFFKYQSISTWERILFPISLIWLIVFLFLLNAFTGIIIFLLLLPVLILWWAFNSKNKLIKKICFNAILILLSTIILYIFYTYERYTRQDKIDTSTLRNYTVNGNAYAPVKNTTDFENGHPTWIYVCERELQQQWDKKSKFKYWTHDLRGQPVRSTLIRYLTSLGFDKDSVGISKLSSKDIDMIEKGYTNCLYKNKIALYPRIYEYVWQLQLYKKTKNPSGQTLAQRIEYFKTGTKLAKKFFWFGAGTGDVDREFKIQYEEDKSLLEPQYRNRAHNQFLTFFITFGVFGFFYICFAIFYAPFLENKYTQFLFCMFFLIGILSMFDDDTLETQAGVTFFAFFYSFLMYARTNTSEIKDAQT